MSSTIEQFSELISRASSKAGLNLTTTAINLLETHFNLLAKWNSTFNLTSLSDINDIIDRLYIDSLFFARKIPSIVRLILDIGSGPGFPGIPILAIRPNIELVIVDPRRKACAFLSEVQFALKNDISFRIANTRADSPDFAIPNARRFPMILSKAFSPPENAFPVIGPIISENGQYLTCLNPETLYPSALQDNFKLISDEILTLPLTGRNSRHLIYQHFFSQ